MLYIDIDISVFLYWKSLWLISYFNDSFLVFSSTKKEWYFTFCVQNELNILVVSDLGNGK